MGKIRVLLVKSKMPLLLSFFVILVLFLGLILVVKAIASPDSPTATPGANIGVCVDPPSPDVSNPRQPIFSWTTFGKHPATGAITAGNPQVGYWLQVDNSPPIVEPAVYQ